MAQQKNKWNYKTWDSFAEFFVQILIDLTHTRTHANSLSLSLSLSLSHSLSLSVFRMRKKLCNSKSFLGPEKKFKG